MVKHYKMFKKGKTWCVMAIATVMAAVGAMGVCSQANADTNTNKPVVSTQVQTSTSSSKTVANSGSALSSAALTDQQAEVPSDSQASQSVVATADTKVVPEVNTNVQVASTQLDGWQNQDGHTYYYQNGQKLTGVQTIGGAQYYFNNLGQRQANYFLNQNNHTYYFQKNGQRLNDGFYNNWGHTYYFQKDGTRLDNGFYNNWGHTYYFGNGGVRLDDGFYSNWGHTYYFGKDGARWDNRFYNNWGHTYYFGNGGVRLDDNFYNNWGHTYYFGKDGARYTNQLYSNWGNTYWFGNGGVLLKNGFVFINSQDWYAQWNGVLRTAQYFSQFTPINAPEGCSVASLAILLSTKGKYFNLGYAYNHVPQAGGVYNVGAFSEIIPASSLAWWAYQNIDSGVHNICGSSLSTISSIVASGHPVLYYGFSSYERAYGNRNHAKVIIGEANGYFHVLDPCYWNRGQHAYTMGGNGYDTGADSWRSWGSVASEYNGSAITIY